MVYDSLDKAVIAKDRLTLRSNPTNNAMSGLWQTIDRPSEMQHQALESQAYPQNRQQRAGFVQLPHFSDQTNIFWVPWVARTGAGNDGGEWLEEGWQIHNLIVDVDDCDLDTKFGFEQGHDVVCKRVVGVNE